MDKINGFLGNTATDAIAALNNGSALVLNDIVPVINNTVLPVRSLRCSCFFLINALVPGRPACWAAVLRIAPGPVCKAWPALQIVQNGWTATPA